MVAALTERATFQNIDGLVQLPGEYTGKSLVRLRGVGVDAYQTIDNAMATNNRNELGARVCVRNSKSVLYIVSRGLTSSDGEMHKSIDEGQTLTEQDAAGAPTGVDTNAIACAIDSLDIIHVIWWDQGTGLRYNTFDTNDDTWGTAADAHADTTTVSNPYVAISIDSNDIPHVVFTSDHTTNDKVEYTNRVGGTWKTPVTMQSSDTYKFDLTIDNNDIPQVIITRSTVNVLAFLGNVNNATSFSNVVISTTSIDNQSPSIALDKQGNTFFSYLSAGDVKMRKHISGDAWSTIQTEVNVATGTFEGTSMTMDQAGDLYIFSNTSVNVTNYWKSSNNGQTWGTAQTDDMITIVDENVKVRWSFYNFHSPSRLDYTLNDVTLNDIYYNVVLSDWRTSIWGAFDQQVQTSALLRGNRNIVRTSKGIIYTVGRNGSVIEIERSNNEGRSFTPTTGGPTGDTFTAYACAIDSNDLIHIIYWLNGTGLRYVTFDALTNTWGTVVTAYSNTGTVGSPGVAISIDSNDVPHTAFQNFTSKVVSYVNRVGGSWGTVVTVQNISHDTSYIDMTLDDDDIPQIIANRTAAGSTDRIDTFIGNQNDATSFTQFNILTSDALVDNLAPSIVIDKQGNTHVSYLSSADVKYRKHLKGDSWATWQTEVNVATGTYEDTTMTIDEKNFPVILTNDSTNVTFAWRTKDSGLTWSVIDTSHNSAGFTDELLRARWSYNNFHFPMLLDYAINDNTGGNLAYNVLFQSGSVYWSAMQSKGNSKVNAQYSADGQGFSEYIDNAGAPASNNESSASAIDGNDDIHTAYWSNAVGLVYALFAVNTMTWGTAETAVADVTARNWRFTSIVIDWNNAPQVIFIGDASGLERLEYTNKVGGTWNGKISVHTNDIDRKFSAVMTEDNLIQVVSIESDGNLKCSRATANDALAFTHADLGVLASYSKETVPSMIVTPNGDSHITYPSTVASGQELKYRKHLKADAWSTWVTDPSITIDTVYTYGSSDMVLGKSGYLFVVATTLSNITCCFSSLDLSITTPVFNKPITHDSTQNDAPYTDMLIRTRWATWFYAYNDTLDYVMYQKLVLDHDGDATYNRLDLLTNINFIKFAPSKSVIT